MDSADTVYLAGKITGDPQYRDKFNEAAQKLTDEGYTVITPTILPDIGFTYAAYIRMTAALMDECAAVCFLPDWKESEGAKGEYRRAKNNKQRIFFYEERAGEAGRIGLLQRR